MVVISPDYPPKHGGVADHTHHLLEHLRSNHDPILITSPGQAPAEHDTAVRAFGAWKDPLALTEAVKAASPDSQAPVLWQYVPHMYGRGGVNTAIIRVMARLQKAGRRQLILAHEIMAPLSWMPHRLFYSLAHRWQWRGILNAMDSVGISTEAWLIQEQERHPHHASKLFLTPSPSNIGVQRSADPREELFAFLEVPDPMGPFLLVFGSYPLRFWDLELPRALDWLKTEFPGILAVGFTGSRLPAVRATRSDIHLRAHVSEQIASVGLQAADGIVLPYLDGVSERRGTFAAACAHGCNIATTTGPGTGPSLRKSGIFLEWEAGNPLKMRDAVDACLRRGRVFEGLAARTRGFYERHLSWPCLMARIHEHLPTPSPQPGDGSHHVAKASMSMNRLR